MKKILFISVLTLAINMSANKPIIEPIKIGEIHSDENIELLVDKQKLINSFENALAIEIGAIEDVKILKFRENIYYLSLLMKGDRTWNFPLVRNHNDISIDFNAVETTCSGVRCNGCCPIVEVCTECVENGSDSPGTCTRSVIGPIMNYFKDILDK